MRAAWHGMTAGLTLGLAGATLASAAGVGELVLPICLAAWIAAIAAFLLAPFRWETFYSVALIASAMLLLGAAGIATVTSGATTGLPAVVSIAVLVIALMLAGFALRRWRRDDSFAHWVAAGTQPG